VRRNFAFDEPVFDSETIKPYGVLGALLLHTGAWSR
jgi:hypothetical protein